VVPWKNVPAVACTVNVNICHRQCGCVYLLHMLGHGANNMMDCQPKVQHRAGCS
jgi:hypothetical protein